MKVKTAKVVQPTPAESHPKVKQALVVFMTFAYDLFKTFKGNRIVEEAHCRKIGKSFDKSNLTMYLPVLVDSMWRIIDGQHRFFECVSRGWPIYFIQMNRLAKPEEMAIINSTQKPWGYEQYMKLYKDIIKNEQYINLDNVLTDMNGSLTASLRLLSYHHDNNSYGDTFKYGLFKLIDEHEARLKTVWGAFNHMKKNWIPNRKMYSPNYLVRALGICEKHSKFDFDRLASQVEKYPDQMYGCRSYDNYGEMILNLYNYNQSKERFQINFV